jgi:Alpha 1,4-glycosyltransferase conserved region/Glycosyltransferase sugar-binding region containing DXD motif
MNKIIQTLWIGRPLSLIEQLSITSFLQNGHEYHLYCYDKIKNIPEGTTLRDASEILPASEIFCYQQGPGKGSVSAFSNLFRYKLLLDRGGWWVDADVVCLKPFDFADPVIFASVRFEAGTRITSAIFKLPPGHAVARKCYEIARNENPANLTWGKTGPLLIDQVVRETGMQHCVKTPDVFSPISCLEWKSLLKNNPPKPVFTDESYAIHLFHEMWRRDGIHVNPATGELRPANYFRELCRQMRGKPKLTFDGTTPFAKLRHRYGLK